MVEGKLECVKLPSWYNIIFGNALVLVIEGKLARASFPSWCNVFLENTFVF
jgi:hypothetical protein